MTNIEILSLIGIEIEDKNNSNNDDYCFLMKDGVDITFNKHTPIKEIINELAQTAYFLGQLDLLKEYVSDEEYDEAVDKLKSPWDLKMIN
jgi:hypothetical protein